MAERQLPGLGLTGFWTPGGDGWDVGMDANLRMLSAVTQMGVLSKTTELPASPTDGQIFIVPSGTDANKIAIRDNGAWVYLTPAAGWRAWIADTTSYAHFDGSAWVDEVDDAGIPDAPNDGKLYGRKNAAWSEVVSSGGGGGDGARFKGDWGALPVVKEWQFEDGVMPSDFAWTSPVGPGSIVVQPDVVEGLSRAIQFPDIEGGTSAYFDVPVTVPLGGANLVVRSWVSSELNYDLFRVFVDGVEKLRRSGQTDTAFNEDTILLDAGERTLRFQYSKDGGGDQGQDTAWISKISIDALALEETYVAGDTVKHDSKYWLCLVDGTAQEPSSTAAAWALIGGGTGGANTAAVSAFIPGTFGSNQLLLSYPVLFVGTLVANALGSIAKAGTGAQAATSLTIQKNGTTVGTVSFAANSTDGTFTVVANVAFAVGDMLTVSAPVTPDATLADVSISFKLAL